jgi:protein subunit release factor A
MYQKYSEQNSWKVSVISSSEVGNSVAAVSAKNMQTFFFFFYHFDWP